ncbi:hypothetical protein BV20DRAFT_485727 [Pilatotrama ljubarskyi]|nr:hypothetical protein BV20DRAFT_485727 [Pilatotrama ljubarskyi]
MQSTFSARGRPQFSPPRGAHARHHAPQPSCMSERQSHSVPRHATPERPLYRITRRVQRTLPPHQPRSSKPPPVVPAINCLRRASPSWPPCVRLGRARTRARSNDTPVTRYPSCLRALRRLLLEPAPRR